MYQLEDAVAALGVKLSAEDAKYVEEPYAPHPALGHS
jgi:aryl-alcohol dehydrogenase-like predicted oxidoreductase